jgi:hypothetical protein
MVPVAAPRSGSYYLTNYVYIHLSREYLLLNAATDAV